MNIIGGKLKNKEQDIKDILALYESGKSLQYIAKIYNYCHHTISRLIKLNDGIIRDDSHKRTEFHFNEDYFNQIDTHEKAQILGIIMADGCISRGTFIIGLSPVDKDYVEWIKNKLEYTGHIKFHRGSGYKNSKGVFRLMIGRKHLITQLKNLGVAERKSLTTEFPSNNIISDNFVHSFVLGFFEGDGGISFNGKNATVMICAPLDFCLGLQNIVKQKLGFEGNIVKNGDKIYTWALGGNRQVYKFLEWIYKDSNFQMKRKYDKFILLKEKYNSTIDRFETNSYGESNPRAKLTNEKVVSIKNMLAEGIYQRNIARIFGVSQVTIKQINKNRTWKHISITA